MSIPRINTLVYLLVGCLLFSLVAVAQETTGGIQGVVKDPTGAVIAKADVEVTSPAMIGKKVLQTDASGYYHFINLPPGDYTLTANAAGFRPFRQTGVGIQVGHLPTIDITLVVGGTQEVVEVSGEGAIVDVTQSKVQTNITQDVLANVPKGRSFQSVIQFAPGARTEPLQSSNLRDNGFQIGGASNSENAYLVEGQETASAFDGSSKANVPMEFIQEVQVKTNGFEAEYGGALGGVVNVIQKRGGNEWHGDAFFVYRGDMFDSAPNRTLRKDPLTAANAGGAKRLDQPAQYYQNKKDTYRVITPGFDLGGPIFKDRLWMFASFAPEYNHTNRTVNFAPSALVPGQRTFTQQDNTYYSLARLDWLATQKIRLYGSWTYQYERVYGFTLPTPDSPYGQYNAASTQNVDSYNYGIGRVYPNSVYNFGADITLNSSTVATTRFGYFKFDNGATRGTPVGIRYFYRDTNYNYPTGSAPALAGTKALDKTALPAQFQHDTGWYNIGDNTGTQFDLWKNYNFNQDLAYFKKGWLGTHNFKVGYGFRKGENNIQSGYNTSDVYVAYNVEYYPNTTDGVTRCLAIIAQNKTKYGAAGGAADGSSCQGNFGTVNVRDLGTAGKVGGWNHSIYFQDAWTPGHGLTVNAGVRLDKEDLPSYIQETGFKGISFGWGQKIAPRLGASYDLLGNGKVKLYGSFGYFYDIMKYQMPRGSFGGDYWHDCVYALDVADYTQIQPARDSKGHYCPLGGGGIGAVGQLPSGGVRLIENYDYRQPANDPTSFGTLGATGLIDPKLKPMQQHEMVFGSDWAINPTLAFEAIYSRKRLDRTIEDTGIITQGGEQYYISNPGIGFNKTVPSFECTNCPINPKANRAYDGVEVRLTRKGTKNINGSLSYTYSRLYGNYSGLTATDVSDGGAGRNGANSDRAFDESFMQFDAHGKVIDGPLGTDRPHTFKAYGYYNLKWFRMNTLFGVYQQVYSGTPLSSYTSVWGAPVFLEGRGKFVNMTRDPVTGNFVAGSVSDKRTPMFSNTDFNFAHEFHVSKSNERLVARFEANISNIFNQHSPVIINQNLVRTGSIQPYRCSTTGGCPKTNQSGIDYGAIESKGYDYVSTINSAGQTLNSLYGMTSNWQVPRNMRFKFAFTF